MLYRLPFLLSFALALTLATAGCSDTPTASIDTDPATTAAAATDACFEGCMERVGEDADAARCAEACANIGGDGCADT